MQLRIAREALTNAARHAPGAPETLFREPVPAVHQASVGREDDRVRQVGLRDARRVLGYRAHRRYAVRAEPAVGVELRHAGDRDRDAPQRSLLVLPLLPYPQRSEQLLACLGVGDRRGDVAVSPAR